MELSSQNHFGRGELLADLNLRKEDLKALRMRGYKLPTVDLAIFAIEKLTDQQRPATFTTSNSVASGFRCEYYVQSRHTTLGISAVASHPKGAVLSWEIIFLELGKDLLATTGHADFLFGFAITLSGKALSENKKLKLALRKVASDPECPGAILHNVSNYWKLKHWIQRGPVSNAPLLIQNEAQQNFLRLEQLRLPAVPEELAKIVRLEAGVTA